MTSNRPYLIRALFDWVIDNGLTPHLLIDTSDQSVVVPQQFVENQKIVLNISTTATTNLVLGNESISFNARFSGQPMNVFLPIESIMAIYAKENGQGMMFAQEDSSVVLNGQENKGDPEPPTPPPSKRPTLKVVK